MSKRNSKSINMPLDEAELDFLNQFLLNRFDDDVDTEGKDEGVFDIATLDGLLTAVVSAPATILPSKWLPSLWGDFPQIWNTQEEFETVYSLLIRHMNSIAALLIDQPENFEPIFYTREVEGKTYTIVDEWCEGYLRGVALGEADWLAGGDDTLALLAPIVAFTKAGNWRAHDCSSEEVENLQAAIAVNVRELHDYWLVRRPSFDSSAAEPHRRSEPRTGRNAPCPCGSGKKFKHCCLH